MNRVFFHLLQVIDVVSLILRKPQLLLTLLQDVSDTCAALLNLLQAQSTALRVIDKTPGLLMIPASNLKRNYDGLLGELGLSASHIKHMVSLQPQLLRYTPDRIASRIEQFTQQLFIPRRQLVHMARRQPAILMMTPESVGAKLQVATSCHRISLQYWKMQR